MVVTGVEVVFGAVPPGVLVSCGAIAGLTMKDDDSWA